MNELCCLLGREFYYAQGKMLPQPVGRYAVSLADSDEKEQSAIFATSGEPNSKYSFRKTPKVQIQVTKDGIFSQQKEQISLPLSPQVFHRLLYLPGPLQSYLD